MGGAACVAAATVAIATLGLPIKYVSALYNIIFYGCMDYPSHMHVHSLVMVTPLCENMPSGSAVKPGDVVMAMNGKTIEVSPPSC